MDRRNQNIVMHTISTLKKYESICRIIKYGAYGVIIYMKPTVLLVPMCELAVRYL